MSQGCADDRINTEGAATCPVAGLAKRALNVCAGVF